MIDFFELSEEKRRELASQETYGWSRVPFIKPRGYETEIGKGEQLSARLIDRFAGSCSYHSSIEISC